jgi:hypothetical protein
VVVIWVVAGVGVQLLPALLWHDEQEVAPVWFMVAGAQAEPIAWQLPQVLLVIGATVCALVPVALDVPVACVPSWQPL